MENVKEEIKPCPFCGSMEIKVDKCTSRVRCKNCFCTSGLIGRLVKYTEKLSDEQAAVMAWNTRYYDGSKND